MRDRGRIERGHGAWPLHRLFAAGPAGMCSFNGGDGALAGFRAIVKVTVDMDGIWHWEGVESHGS